MKLYIYIGFYQNWPEIFHAVICSTIKNMSSTIKNTTSTIKSLFTSTIFFVNSTIKRFAISTINEFYSRYIVCTSALFPLVDRICSVSDLRFKLQTSIFKLQS